MDNYEFTSAENQTINGLRATLQHVGILFGIMALIQLTRYVVRFSQYEGIQEAVLISSIVLFALMGIAFFRPLGNLKNIVATKDSDIKELMQALTGLRAAFTFASIVFVLLIVAINIDSVRVLLP